MTGEERQCPACGEFYAVPVKGGGFIHVCKEDPPLYLTLRDHFACAALQGMLSDGWGTTEKDGDDAVEIQRQLLTSAAYNVADLMLERRKQ